MISKRLEKEEGEEEESAGNLGAQPGVGRKLRPLCGCKAAWIEVNSIAAAQRSEIKPRTPSTQLNRILPAIRACFKLVLPLFLPLRIM